MAKEVRRNIIPWGIVLAVPPSILAILGVVLMIAPYFEPDLEATANGGNWKAPSDVVKELKGIAQAEADNVESLRTMCTIEIHNNGGMTSNRIVLEITDAKYVQYENHGTNSTITGNFRDDKCRIVPMGLLEPEGKILATAWAVCSASPDGHFKIIQDNHGTVPLYMKAPVGSAARWVNKHPRVSLALMLLFVFMLCVSARQSVMKLFW